MAAPNQGFAEAYKDVVHEDAIKIGARAQPDLGCNIKCGNSLIGSDFYNNQQLSFPDEDERQRPARVHPSVYELYGLTGEEIAIVEETTASKK